MKDFQMFSSVQDSLTGGWLSNLRFAYSPEIAVILTNCIHSDWDSTVPWFFLIWWSVIRIHSSSLCGSWYTSCDTHKSRSLETLGKLACIHSSYSAPDIAGSLAVYEMYQDSLHSKDFFQNSKNSPQTVSSSFLREQGHFLKPILKIPWSWALPQRF